MRSNGMDCSWSDLPVSDFLNAERRTKAGEEDKGLAAANNEADRKARGERLMTGG